MCKEEEERRGEEGDPPTGSLPQIMSNVKSSGTGFHHAFSLSKTRLGDMAR